MVFQFQFIGFLLKKVFFFVCLLVFFLFFFFFCFFGGGGGGGGEKQNSADDKKNAKLRMYRFNADRLQYGFRSKVYRLAKFSNKCKNEMHRFHSLTCSK